MVGQIGQLGTWHFGLITTSAFITLPKSVKTMQISFMKMQAMIGSFATPDGADWGEANIEEMNEVIQEAI